LIPVILAGSAVLALPAAPPAAGGATDTATSTYVVNLDKSEIDVTVQIKIKNTTPNKTIPDACYNGSSMWYCPDIETFYFTDTYLWVPAQAGPVSASANAGKVKQSVYKSDAYGRELKLTFAKLYYGNTRTVTATYAIPAGPRAAGGYRALKAYVELCASGAGEDSGAVNVVVPDGFAVAFTDDTALSLASDAKRVLTYSSGSVATPSDFYTCLDATNPSAMSKSTVAAGDQQFDLDSWPEDTSWAATIRDALTVDVPKLEGLTGLKMPGGTITVEEVASSQLGEYAGMYDSLTKSASITDDTDSATVAHELSHIWFNDGLFAATWMDEGFAGYSEQVAGDGNNKPCADPGTSPGTGSAILAQWKYLDLNSTKDDTALASWDYAASCYLVTKLAGAMGPANFKAVLVAAESRRQAYVGGDPANQAAGNQSAITAQQLLDLIDEFGMMPSGAKDPAQAQGLFISYGIVTAAGASGRTDARAAYHTLLAAAGKWGLPLAVQASMETWNFGTAQKEMAAATKILSVRDQIKKTLPDVDQNGTQLEKLFESAKSAADLDSVLTVAQAEAATASKMSEAASAEDGSHNPLQAIGLLGTDLGATVKQATTELGQAKPADASASAEKVIDEVNGATVLGLIRLLLLIVLLLLAVALAFLGRWLIRRRAAMAMALSTATATAAAAAAAADGAVSADTPATTSDVSVAAADVTVSAETTTPPPAEPPAEPRA
jgi:hypothetical protein